MKRGRPIKPEELPELKAEIIPPFVFDAVNELLAKHQSSTINLTIGQVKGAIKNAIPPGETFQSWWLNFESCYREAGWKVEYDGPAWNESYEGSYTFQNE